MPLFVLLGRDGARGVELRKLHRDAHLANLQQLADENRIVFAGPLRDAEGLPRGSVVVFAAADLESARRIAESDPYTREGVFETFEVFETLQVLPSPA
jgi:uncharacterized protein YciI